MRQASREMGSGAAIAERLRERRAEIEEAILTRLYAVSEPPDTGGPEYTEGLRAATAAALTYGIEGIEGGEHDSPSLPEAPLTQARLAARSGVSLDTILRRYFAGYTLLEDFLVQEAEGDLSPAALKGLLRAQAASVDRLLAAVSNAYTEEVKRRSRSTARRKAETVERLLDGELLDASALGYELEGHHLGLFASGPGAKEAFEALAKGLDARLLAIPREEGILWAWLGSRRRLDPGALQQSFKAPPDLFVAFGEPGEGLPSWRLTHRQAQAALSVALRGGERVARYRDVALVASMIRDELLLTSLQALFLTPLEADPDGGEALRATLRAYFTHDRNASSAAVALGVSRRTIARRLQRVEEMFKRPLSDLEMSLDAALALHELDSSSARQRKSHGGTQTS